MVLVVKPFEIVVSGCLKFVRALLRTVPGDIVRADGNEGVMAVIVFPDRVAKFLRNAEAVAAVRIIDFIADAPEED